MSHDIKVGETTIVKLYNGGYFPYLSKPGEVEFRHDYSGDSVTLDIKAGETYYIKGLVHVYFFWRPWLVVVSQDVAEDEISQCKLNSDPVLISRQSRSQALGALGCGLMFAPLLITPACLF